MQQTLNNYFGSKKRSTTLCQVKIGKHECQNVTDISALVLTCFHLTKGRATFFRPETIVVSFLHLMVLLFKVLSNHHKNEFFKKAMEKIAYFVFQKLARNLYI